MLLHGKMEGIGNFTFETMRLITKQHPEHQFYFIFDRPFDPSFIFSDNIIPVYISPPARHPILWYIWYEWSLRKLLRKIRPHVRRSLKREQEFSSTKKLQIERVTSSTMRSRPTN